MPGGTTSDESRFRFFTKPELRKVLLPGFPGFFLRRADFSDSRAITAFTPFVTGKIYAKSAFFQKKTPGLAGGSVFGRSMDLREPRNEKLHSVVAPIEDEYYGTEEYGFENVIDQRVSIV